MYTFSPPSAHDRKFLSWAAVLNCELGQALPHQMFYIALQIIRGDHLGKQTSKQKYRRISSVGGFAQIM